MADLQDEQIAVEQQDEEQQDEEQQDEEPAELTVEQRMEQVHVLLQKENMRPNHFGRHWSKFVAGMHNGEMTVEPGGVYTLGAMVHALLDDGLLPDLANTERDPHKRRCRDCNPPLSTCEKINRSTLRRKYEKSSNERRLLTLKTPNNSNETLRNDNPPNGTP